MTNNNNNNNNNNNTQLSAVMEGSIPWRIFFISKRFHVFSIRFHVFTCNNKWRVSLKPILPAIASTNRPIIATKKANSLKLPETIQNHPKLYALNCNQSQTTGNHTKQQLILLGQFISGILVWQARLLIWSTCNIRVMVDASTNPLHACDKLLW